jgi:hypothetical protein
MAFDMGGSLNNTVLEQPRNAAIEVTRSGVAMIIQYHGLRLHQAVGFGDWL